MLNPYFLVYFLVFILFLWASIALWVNREKTYLKWVDRLAEKLIPISAKSEFLGFFDEAVEARVWWQTPRIMLVSILKVFFPVAVLTGCSSVFLILYQYNYTGWLVLLGLEIAILVGAVFGQFELFKLRFEVWCTGTLLFTWDGVMTQVKVTNPSLFGPGMIFLDGLQFDPADAKAVYSVSDIQTLNPKIQTGDLQEWFISWVLLPRHIMAVSVEAFVARTAGQIMWLNPREFEKALKRCKSKSKLLTSLKQGFGELRAKLLLGEPVQDQQTYDREKAIEAVDIAKERLEEETGPDVMIDLRWFLKMPRGVATKAPPEFIASRANVLRPSHSKPSLVVV